jgi:DNA-binding response OmpR family regulator
MAHSILVVDDEKLIVKGIKFSLEQDGMKVDVAYDGEEALQLAKDNEYDLILLDVMLPKIEGTSVCQQIREFSSVPVVMVTAKGDDMDKIMGLEYGADDYITKPFNILELKARIKAILRRSSVAKIIAKPLTPAHQLQVRELKIETEYRRVFVRENEINLTAKEYDLLEFFMKNPGRVYDREHLLKQIWGHDMGVSAARPDFPAPDVRTVDVHVRRLREKIEESPGEPKYIHTKWGVGYYFR